MNILWKLTSITSNIASLRYRCFIPIFESQALHATQRHFIIDDWRFLFFQKPQFVVYIKSISDQDVAQALIFKTQKVKIIFDTCDNLLDAHKEPDIQKNFIKMLNIADHVTVPTEVLKYELVNYLGVEHKQRISVIPDPSENFAHVRWSQEFCRYRYLKDILAQKNFVLLIQYFFKSLLGFFRNLIGWFYKLYIQICLVFIPFRQLEWIKSASSSSIHKRLPLYFRLLFFPYAIPWIVLRELTLKKMNIPYKYRYAFLKKVIVAFYTSSSKLDKNIFLKDKKYIHLLWFGNSGTYGVSGVSDLLILQRDLEKLNSSHKVTLTVVSNNYEYFERLQKKISVPMYYIPWTVEKIYQIASDYDCVVIPNTMNEFSKGKSSNRTFLSLSLGLPVVATPTAELEDLSNCVLFENWCESILKYRENPILRVEHLENFKKIFTESKHNPKNVWSQWCLLFENLSAEINMGSE